MENPALPPQAQLYPLPGPSLPALSAISMRKPTRFEQLCQKLVLHAFAGMQKGHLVMTLPDGEQVTMGAEGPDCNYTAQIQVLDYQFFVKVVQYSHIGFSESYMEQEWTTPDLVAVISWFILNIDNSTVLEGSRQKIAAFNIMGGLNRLYHRVRHNSMRNSRKNIHAHYDLGNDFFSLFLDPTMTYSSACFTYPEQSLESAQIEKYEALCRKMRLKASHHILEIGTGWGGFACHAARKYGCRVTTTTISQEQFAFASHRVREAGLEHLVTVIQKDYRDLQRESYDRIVSIEMIEAVGDKYYEAFFAKCHELLRPDGLLALQMITCPDSRFEILKNNVDFIQKHIFPGSLLPSIGRVHQALKRTGDLSLFEMTDMGLSYARTLGLWKEAFNQHLGTLHEKGFDDVFIRKWNYYFDYCRAAFLMRNISVVQAVFSRPNNPSLMLPGGQLS